MREVISEIENVYGQDVISSSYNKIYRLVSAAQKASADDKRSNGLSVACAGQWLVESLLVALRTNKLTVSGVTLLTLDKHQDFRAWFAASVDLQASGEDELVCMWLSTHDHTDSV